MVSKEDGTSNSEGIGHAVGYVRVCDDGDDSAEGVEAQKNEILEFADDKEVQVDGWFVDVGDDGRSMERPGLQDLLNAVRSSEGSCDAVLVLQPSRLCSIQMNLTLVRAALGRFGVKLISVREADRSSGHSLIDAVVESLDPLIEKERAEAFDLGFLQGRASRGQD